MNANKTQPVEVNDYGLTKEQSETVKDIVPSLSLANLKPDSKAIELEILTNKPLETTITPKKGFNKDKVTTLKYLDCIDKASNMKVRLFLSSESLKREMYKIGIEHNHNLKGLFIRIGCRYYDHPAYGSDTVAYIINEYKPVA